MREGQQHHRGVVDIGIPVVIEFEAQPDGSTQGRFTDQSPLRRISCASSQSAALVIAGIRRPLRPAHTRRSPCPTRVRSRAEEECLAVVDDQVLKLPDRFHAHR